ncbi:hypothetical protein GCM10023080_094690 [Streptomyces pseudoechinosporeus]
MQYAWQVWPRRGKKSTVSRYLCWIPGAGRPSILGTFRSRCPAGWGFSLLRIPRTTSFTRSRDTDADSSAATRSRSARGSISGCGNVSRNRGSSGTADQSMSRSTTYAFVRNGRTAATACA